MLRLSSGVLLIFICFSHGNAEDIEPRLVSDPQDPWENTNRKIHDFNDILDRNIIKPVAQTYQDYTHKVVRTGVHNFFSNLGDVFVVVNDVLQFKLVQALQDTTRFIINSTFGIAGIFDVASMVNLTKHNEDFGQTLMIWGVDQGPYIVLPFFGPSTVRSLTGGMVKAYYANSVNNGIYYIDTLKNIKPYDFKLAAQIVDLVSMRASLLKVEKTLDSISLDRYATIRGIYLQHLEFLATDGKANKPKQLIEAVKENPPEDDYLDGLDAMSPEDEDL